MAGPKLSLTDTRRRAVDRLLVEYLELHAEQRPGFLARSRTRYPRLARWLEELAEGSHTISFLDQPAELAKEAMARPEETVTPKLVAGRRLGLWRVVELSGKGGMGAVYRGERADGAFEMAVAIKLIHFARIGLAELLQREFRLLARLDQSSVSRLMDAGLDNQAGPFLVMEWVEGTDLEEWLAENSPGLDTRLEVLQSIASAVAHAHQRLAVHGNIKPGSVRIRADGQVKLLDFGVARLVAEGAANPEAVTALTPSFAAPERLQDEPASTASDVWSLGALLRWLVSGPMSDGESGFENLGLGWASRKRSRELAAMIQRACAEEPDDRYPSVVAFLEDLKRFVEHRPVQAVQQTTLYRAGKFTRRNPGVVGGITATLAALLVGLTTTTMLYLEAGDARREAMMERERAEVRVRQLEQVASFQETQLAEIDPAMMGAGLRSGIMMAEAGAGSGGQTLRLLPGSVTADARQRGCYPSYSGVHNV